MLISDPAADKAAAALEVRAGHFDDPESMPGLAHFTEHMLRKVRQPGHRLRVVKVAGTDLECGGGLVSGGIRYQHNLQPVGQDDVPVFPRI